MKSDQPNSRHQGKPAENSRIEEDSDSTSAQDKQNADEEFPGYPHYPAKEDIMHPANRMEKVTPDPEKLTRSGAYLDPKTLDKPVSSSLDVAADTDDDIVIVPGTEADVTREDLIILGEQNLDIDEEEAKKNLRERQ